MVTKIFGGIVSITTLALVSVGLVTAAPVMKSPAILLGLAGVAMPMAAEQYYCTTETFSRVRTDRYVKDIGGLNFGNRNFAGFDQADWINPDGSHLWPDCADKVIWMPAAGQIASTEEPLTRLITFECDYCRLTQITVAAHQSVDGSESQTGVVTIRGLDKRGRQVGDAISTELNYNDGCVTIDTEFTQNHAKIEISYSRGSELGIVDMTYCCGTVEGCSAEFWKQPRNFDEWKDYTRSDDFDTVFGVDLFKRNVTLLQALQCWGFGRTHRPWLARESVAALLNATSTEMFYPYTEEQVIALVQAGEVGALARANDLRCPLARNEHGHWNGHDSGNSNH